MTVENHTEVDGAYVRYITSAGERTLQVEISAETADEAVEALLKYEKGEGQ